MSNNAVLCISDNTKTVRLTAYSCKPAVLLIQLDNNLRAINSFDIDELVTSLLENGFDLDADTNAAFTPVDMCTNTLVNWAWLLDLENKTLKYWDVTAALNGLEETIREDSISPLDYLNWMSTDKVEEYKSIIVETEQKLKELDVSIVNY